MHKRLLRAHPDARMLARACTRGTRTHIATANAPATEELRAGAAGASGGAAKRMAKRAQAMEDGKGGER